LDGHVLADYVKNEFRSNLTFLMQEKIPEVSTFLSSLQIASPFGPLENPLRGERTALLKDKVPSAILRYFQGSQQGSSLDALSKLPAETFEAALKTLKCLADIYLMQENYRLASTLYEIILKRLLPLPNMKTAVQKITLTQALQQIYNQALTRFILSTFFIQQNLGRAMITEDLTLLFQNTSLLLEAVRTLQQQDSPSQGNSRLKLLQHEYFFQFHIYTALLLEDNRENDYIAFLYKHLYQVCTNLFDLSYLHIF
jgi:hypothetical protein